MRSILVTTVNINSYLFIIYANSCLRSSFLELSLILLPRGDVCPADCLRQIECPAKAVSDQWQRMMERRVGRSQASAALGERGLEHLAKRVY